MVKGFFFDGLPMSADGEIAHCGGEIAVGQDTVVLPSPRPNKAKEHRTLFPVATSMAPGTAVKSPPVVTGGHWWQHVALSKTIGLERNS